MATPRRSIARIASKFNHLMARLAPSATDSDQVVSLSLNNHGGSVQHYYHFLLGFLLPLVHWYENNSGDRYKRIIVRSCGIMDAHIESLGFRNVSFSGRSSAGKIGRDSLIRRLEIEGYDNPQLDYAGQIIAAKNTLVRQLLSAAEVTPPGSGVRGAPSILFVNRGKPDPFYSSKECELKTASNQRRSLPNFEELTQSIEDLSPKLVYLEDCSLVEQIRLFSSCDIVVAQHGAALANIVFCRVGATVIEICPKEIRKPLRNQGDFFAALASQMNLSFLRIWQDHSHANVDLEAFESCIRTAIDH